jgi:hypothetical protein
MSTDAKAIQKLVDSYLAYERELHKTLSPEEIAKIVEAERAKEKAAQGVAGTTQTATRR